MPRGISQWRFLPAERSGYKKSRDARASLLMTVVFPRNAGVFAVNPRPANDMDRNALVEQLSRLDACDPGDASISEASSTVWGLKAELDTLIVQLREPAGPDPFASESGLRREPVSNPYFRKNASKAYNPKC